MNWSISGWRRISNRNSNNKRDYSCENFENISQEEDLQSNLSDDKFMLETEEKIKSLTIETVVKEPVSIKTDTKAINNTENHVKSCPLLIGCLLCNLKKSSNLASQSSVILSRHSSDVANLKKPDKLFSYQHKTNNFRKKIIVECCSNLNSNNKENSTLSKSESVQSLNQLTTDKSGSSENLLELTKFFQAKSKEWEGFSKNLVDSHCHLDIIFAK